MVSFQDGSECRLDQPNPEVVSILTSDGMLLECDEDEVRPLILSSTRGSVPPLCLVRRLFGDQNVYFHICFCLMFVFVSAFNKQTPYFPGASVRAPPNFFRDNATYTKGSPRGAHRTGIVTSVEETNVHVEWLTTRNVGAPAYRPPACMQTRGAKSTRERERRDGGRGPGKRGIWNWVSQSFCRPHHHPTHACMHGSSMALHRQIR